MNKTVAFCTLGCKVNQYETNAMIQRFKESNYEIVEFEEKADIYIINTCTVTNMADRKSRQMLRKVKELNPKAVLVAVGCYAQVAKEELEKIPEIDLILGNNQKKNIVKFIEQYQNRVHPKKVNSVFDMEEDNTKTESLDKAIYKLKEANVTDVMHCEEYVDFGDVTFTEKNRAVIKVQDGCDRFCSYCIIPFARGHIRSRNPESVISEITKIAKNGIKEVVITGIHLASYGRDFNNKQELLKNENLNQISKAQHKNEYRLIDLLEDINKIEGIERIRLRFIRTNINNRRVCTEII